MDSTALKMANAVEAEAVMSGRRCSRSHYQVKTGIIFMDSDVTNNYK
jgi:hypothetical protein